MVAALREGAVAAVGRPEAAAGAADRLCAAAADAEGAAADGVPAQPGLLLLASLGGSSA